MLYALFYALSFDIDVTWNSHTNIPLSIPFPPLFLFSPSQAAVASFRNKQQDSSSSAKSTSNGGGGVFNNKSNRPLKEGGSGAGTPPTEGMRTNNDAAAVAASGGFDQGETPARALTLAGAGTQPTRPGDGKRDAAGAKAKKNLIKSLDDKSLQLIAKVSGVRVRVE